MTADPELTAEQRERAAELHDATTQCLSAEITAALRDASDTMHNELRAIGLKHASDAF